MLRTDRLKTILISITSFTKGTINLSSCTPWEIEIDVRLSM